MFLLNYRLQSVCKDFLHLACIVESWCGVMKQMPCEISPENIPIDINFYSSGLECYYALGGYKDAFAVIKGHVDAISSVKGYFFACLSISFEIADMLLYIELGGLDDDRIYTDLEEHFWISDVKPFEDVGIVVGDCVEFTAFVYAYYRYDGQIAYSLKCPQSIHKITSAEVEHLSMRLTHEYHEDFVYSHCMYTKQCSREHCIASDGYKIEHILSLKFLISTDFLVEQRKILGISDEDILGKCELLQEWFDLGIIDEDIYSYFMNGLNISLSRKVVN